MQKNNMLESIAINSVKEVAKYGVTKDELLELVTIQVNKYFFNEEFIDKAMDELKYLIKDIK